VRQQSPLLFAGYLLCCIHFPATKLKAHWSEIRILKSTFSLSGLHRIRRNLYSPYVRAAGASRNFAPAAALIYFTRTTRVAVEFELSLPSNFTVPVGRNWKLAGGGGPVTPTVIVMVCTLMDFPRAAIVQTI